MRKSINNLVLMTGLAALLGSCTIVTPSFTTVDKMSKLKSGMNKSQVINTLEIYPFDILHSDMEGCEIHWYKYKHKERKYSGSPLDLETETGLTAGKARYSKDKDVYLVFRGDELKTVMTTPGMDQYAELIRYDQTMAEECKNSGKFKGCTDPQAANYSEDAEVDDGTCIYCKSGYMINPDYGKIPGAQPCIEEVDDCAPCDVIDKVIQQENGHLDIRLDLNQPREK